MRHRRPLLFIALACAMFLALAPTARATERPLYARAAMIYAGTIKGLTFDEAALRRSALSFVNRPVLKGHDWRDPDACVGVIIATAVHRDPGSKLVYLEGILKIMTPDAKRRVSKGLFHYLSIGFTGIRYVCNVDGEENCLRHRPGSTVFRGRERILVRRVLHSITGQEVSFVNVPAVRHARVLEVSDRRLSVGKPVKNPIRFGQGSPELAGRGVPARRLPARRRE